MAPAPQVAHLASASPQVLAHPQVERPMQDFVRATLRMSSAAQKPVDPVGFAGSPTLAVVPRSQVRFASHMSVVLLYRFMP